MSDFLRNTMLGSNRGLGPAALRTALSLASCAYGWEVRRRNRSFDRGIDVHSAGVPVISVGNLTAGGTGKTPVVALLANYFRRWGVNVAILSRGYGSKPASVNDEALVLERLCPVPHVQQPDRVAGAARATATFGSELLILDDGFQHRRLGRDFDVVLIDATNPFGFGHLLPRGLLREPIDSLKRADLVLLTRADCVSRSTRTETLVRIGGAAPHVPIVDVAFPPVRLVNASGEGRPLESLDEVPTLAFCGIGNPAGFAATLRAASIRPADIVPFRDHHHYDVNDLVRLALRARALGAAAAVTTLKDLVKLRDDRLPAPSGVPLWAIETGCDVIANGDALFAKLDEFVARTATPKAA
jgi:tetraacyldisaccharide 4'-kinase